ncbi:hypothetical protein B9Z55_009106 [Caenorhabditis nigoni]|uniref:RING-type domain-containing protein n=1 Tax=Caenorhabditis nigoni TaxID=1611254 RepID=A0A2G5UQL9_9PELO|nr:hypothetical protein B9Z55_009106 [Caenorhabditis nigoni]
METFHSVLEEFNINKGLITIVPDPVYEMSKEMMLEFGRDTVRRLSQNVTWLLDSTHAVFYMFQRVVWGINWKTDRCTAHENCHIQMKRMIIETMRHYQSAPEGTLIPLDAICSTIKWLKNQCYNTLGYNGTFIDVRTSVAMDTTTHLHMMFYHHVYLMAVDMYRLPNYHSYVHFPNGFPLDACSAEIPLWMTRFLLLAGWTQQFFDKESVDMASVILRLILKKVPVEFRSSSVFLLNTVQASLAGTNYIPPPGAKIGLNSNTKQEEQAHQKVLRKAQERAEKLRQRKEQSKLNKAVRPSTKTIKEVPLSDEFVGELLLEEQEYLESKLKITRRDFEYMHTLRARTPVLVTHPNHKDQHFGNVPNVFSLLDNKGEKGTLGIGDSETSSTEELAEEETIMNTDVNSMLKMDEYLDTIDEFQKEEQEVVELGETEELVTEESIIKKVHEDETLKIYGDHGTIDEFQREKEDVHAMEEEVDLETEDMVEIEVEILREKAGELDQLKKELAELVNDIELQSIDEKARSTKLAKLLDEKTRRVEDLENQLIKYGELVQTMTDTVEDMEREKKELLLKLKDVHAERDLDKRKMEEEKKSLKRSLDEKTRKVDDLEKKNKEISLKLKDVEKKRDVDIKKMEVEKKTIMCSLDERTRKVDEVEKELNRLKKQSENQEKLLKEKDAVIERFKVEAEKSKSLVSEKDAEIARKNNELSESSETSELLVLQLSRLEEEMRMLRIEEQEKNEVILKENEQLQTTNRHLSIQNEEQQKTIQNLYGRLAMVPSPPVSIQEDKPESVQSPILTIKNLVDKLSNAEDSEEARQFRITLQRLRNIKDRFQNKDQLKLARTMTDKLIQMSNRSEIRELAQYEYQQYEANFQNYTQLVDLNIEKMKETRDCSLYSPLPKPPAFSDRFMNEYWLECDKEKKELEMDISDSECLICFFEMNSDQKTLKCDHCNKITHLKCASKWLQIHRSCPHCRREQLDPEEFPALS